MHKRLKKHCVKEQKIGGKKNKCPLSVESHTHTQKYGIVTQGKTTQQ